MCGNKEKINEMIEEKQNKENNNLIWEGAICGVGQKSICFDMHSSNRCQFDPNFVPKEKKN